MTLNGYVEIPPAATNAGAPIDAFLLRTLRENDVFAEKRLRATQASPFTPNGVIIPNGGSQNVTINGAITPEHRTFCYNAKTITLSIDLVTEAAVPLVWFATEEIHLAAHIDASGKGALASAKGNFGGSGGGRNGTASEPCLLPLSGVETAAAGAGAASSNGGNGTDLAERWASRIFLNLLGATGGGKGAGTTGGLGGGIVILCAPKITVDAGKHIWAKGMDGAVDVDGDGNGGGGGGLIVLIANEFTNAIPPADLDVSGGAGNAPSAPAKSGGNGGAGKVLQFTYS